MAKKISLTTSLPTSKLDNHTSSDPLISLSRKISSYDGISATKLLRGFMKTKMFVLLILTLSTAGITLSSCGGSGDEDGDTYDYNFSVSGKFISQARRTSKETNAFTIDRASAVDIDIQNRLFWYYNEVMSVSKEYSPSVADEMMFPGFSGAGLWYSADVGNCTAIINTNASDGSLTLFDGSVVTATSNGVEYNGVEYYNQSYFNSHVDSWTNSETATNENVSVSIKVVQKSSSSMLRSYEVTVTATGSGFTVKRIQVYSTSGEYVSGYRTTSENSATITVNKVSTRKATIVGRVTTTSGNSYESESRTIY